MKEIRYVGGDNVTVQILAGAMHDLAGNPNNASGKLMTTYDVTRPRTVLRVLRSAVVKARDQHCT